MLKDIGNTRSSKELILPMQRFAGALSTAAIRLGFHK